MPTSKNSISGTSLEISAFELLSKYHQHIISHGGFTLGRSSQNYFQNFLKASNQSLSSVLRIMVSEDLQISRTLETD